MPESPRPNQDMEEEAAIVDETLPAASALHAKTKVVKFDDFQSSFFPTRTEARRSEDSPAAPEESHH